MSVVAQFGVGRKVSDFFNSIKVMFVKNQGEFFEIKYILNYRGDCKRILPPVARCDVCTHTVLVHRMSKYSTYNGLQLCASRFPSTP